MNLLNVADTCLRHDVPSCSGICPFHVDILTLLDHIGKGKWNRAIEQYRKAVVFPYIVSEICPAPCEHACFRSRVDEAVQIKALEKAAVSLGRRRRNSHRSVQRDRNILIIGAGLSGITCAVRLAERGWQVRIVDENERPGGSLWEKHPGLDAGTALEELEQVLDSKNIVTSFGEKICENHLSGYDAVIVAAGSKNDLNPAGDGFFYTGEAEDSSRNLITCISDAAKTINNVDAYLRNVRPVRTEEPLSRYCPDTTRWEHKESVLSRCVKLKGEQYEEAVKIEAQRCQQCVCRECTDSCNILSSYYKDPLKAFDEIIGSIHKTEMSVRKGQPFIINCTLCGKCGTKCPQSIDFGEICLEARQQLQTKNELPPVYHEYWINETRFSSEKDAALIRASKDPEWVFFPGCQLGSSDPEYVTETYEMLLEKLGPSGGIFLRCCGIPFHWAGKEEQFREQLEDVRREYASLGSPVVILTCPSCRKVFEQYLPGVRTQMLWNVLPEPSYIHNAEPDKTYVLFDPCISAGSPEMRGDIRAFLDTAGIQYESSDPEKGSGGCCGYGGLIYLKNERIYRETAASAVNWSENDILTYCINCRDSFATQSRRTVHILDLLMFGDDRAVRKPPTPTERHKNRVITRNELLRRFWPEESENKDTEAAPDHSDEPEIHFNESAKAEIARMLLFEDDILSLVREAVSENRMIRTGDSIFSCYGRIGSLTSHVNFRIENGAITITDVYAHRINYIGPDMSETGREHSCLMCSACSSSLTDCVANFEYLGHRIRHTVPVCPVCGQMYITKELCRSRINELEMLLEEK